LLSEKQLPSLFQPGTGQSEKPEAIVWFLAKNPAFEKRDYQTQIIVTCLDR
jgi:hypothetical protein